MASSRKAVALECGERFAVLFVSVDRAAALEATAVERHFGVGGLDDAVDELEQEFVATRPAREPFITDRGVARHLAN